MKALIIAMAIFALGTGCASIKDAGGFEPLSKKEIAVK